MSLIPCQRVAFDIPPEVAYLNCGYMSPLSRAVVEAGRQAIQRKAQPWGTVAEDFFSPSELARDLFARVVGADVEGVAIIPSVSYGMAAATRNLPLASGEEIVVLEDQFPSNVYPWRRLANDCGATIRSCSPPPGQSWTQSLLEVIGDRTAIVAIPNCHWVDGALVDVEAVAARCRERGAALVLDLTQSLGARPIDLSSVKPDFAIVAAYKWLMGPYALGFMWVHPRWRDGIPVEEGWIVRRGAEDFAGLVDYEDRYEKGARRFDMGERSQFQLLPMASAAMAQVLDWGIANIAETLTVRTQQIADGAAKLGFYALPPGERAAHYLGLSHDAPLPTGLVQRLAQQGVYVSMRGESVRVTPHLYTTDEDVDRFTAALSRALTA